MKAKQKATKPARRDERHSAAWGKPMAGAVMTLVLVTGMAFAQAWDGAEEQHTPLSPRISAELNHELTQARQGLGGNESVSVIVQYKRSPKKETLARLQNQGGLLSRKLDVIQGAAFKLPVSALAALENDPKVAYVSVDHALQAFDDINDTAVGNDTNWFKTTDRHRRRRH